MLNHVARTDSYFLCRLTASVAEPPPEVGLAPSFLASLKRVILAQHNVLYVA